MRGLGLPPGATTRGQSSDGLEPYFALRPHDPDACVPAGSKRPCPTCGGACKRDRSMFVCMGCHGVSPSRQKKYDAQRRDDELAEIGRKRAAKKIRFQAKLSQKQRRSLVAEYGAEAEAWLASIDQPANDRWTPDFQLDALDHVEPPHPHIAEPDKGTE